MGIHDLWDILQPVQTSQTLPSDRNTDEVWAVDLAGWICEAESAGSLKVNVSKPYLRNLFFRVNQLSRHGVRLIFVIDGRPPKLKWKTIAKRMDHRKDLEHGKQYTGSSRGQLNVKFAECCTLLNHLGVPWVKADGEAEATCAALNDCGIANACVTGDNDTFLYGARTVYRNLATDEKKKISFDCYKMDDIEAKLQLDRNSLITIGLLLGCDYCEKGVPGVGKSQTLKLLSLWRGQNSLEKLQSWRNSPPPVFTLPTKPAHCSWCHHAGSKRAHKQDECATCGTMCRDGHTSNSVVLCHCVWHAEKRRLSKVEVEHNVRLKAIKIDNFPDRDIIDEYLRERIVSRDDITRSRNPELWKTVDFLQDRLQWSYEYALDKALCYVTSRMLTTTSSAFDYITLLRITRARVKDFTPMFEVEWQLRRRNGEEISESLCTTVEKRELIARRFPASVERFERQLALQAAEKKQSKKKMTKKTNERKPEPNTSKLLTDFFRVQKSCVVERVRKSDNECEDSVPTSLDDAGHVTEPGIDDIIHPARQHSDTQMTSSVDENTPTSICDVVDFFEDDVIVAGDVSHADRVGLAGGFYEKHDATRSDERTEGAGGVECSNHPNLPSTIDDDFNPSAGDFSFDLFAPDDGGFAEVDATDHITPPPSPVFTTLTERLKLMKINS